MFPSPETFPLPPLFNRNDDKNYVSCRCWRHQFVDMAVARRCVAPRRHILPTGLVRHIPSHHVTNAHPAPQRFMLRASNTLSTLHLPRVWICQGTTRIPLPAFLGKRALLRFMLRARKTASVTRSSRSGSSGLRRPTGSATSCCAAASCLLAAHVTRSAIGFGPCLPSPNSFCFYKRTVIVSTRQSATAMFYGVSTEQMLPGARPHLRACRPSCWGGRAWCE